MGFVYVVPTTVGGTVLIIERIESQNYVPNVSGWAIYANGNAEFNDVLARGIVVIGNPLGQRVELSTLFSGQPEIDFWTGNADQDVPGRINMGGPGSPVYLLLESGHDVNSISGNPARIWLESNASSVPGNDIRLEADEITVDTPIRWFTDRTGWNNVPLTNGWANLPGGTAQYRKDAAGTVHVRGTINAGTNVVLNTALPPEYRPTQSEEYPLYAGNPGPLISVVRIAPTGVMTLLTNAGAGGAQTRLSLCFSYPGP